MDYRQRAAALLLDLLPDSQNPEADALIDSAIRKLKKLPERPQGRAPYEGLFLPPKPTQQAVAIRARFTMDLGRSSTLRTGHLSLYDQSGKQIFTAVATSGLPGFQSEQHLKTRARGPIPPKKGIEFKTKPLWLEIPGVDGWFYPISPFHFNDYSRGDFGVHADTNVAGSSGCPVIRDRETFNNKFVPMMRASHEAGIATIPLEVEYS